MSAAAMTLVDQTVFQQAEGRAQARPPVRYRFLRFAGLVSEVIVDIFPDGREEWAHQYPGELRWFSFTPTAIDRAMLHYWRDSSALRRQGTFGEICS